MIKDIGNNSNWFAATNDVITVPANTDVFGLIVDTIGYEGGAGQMRVYFPNVDITVTMQEGDDELGTDMEDMPVERSQPVVIGGGTAFTTSYKIAYVSNKRYIRMKFTGDDAQSVGVSGMIFLYPAKQGPV